MVAFRVPTKASGHWLQKSEDNLNQSGQNRPQGVRVNQKWIIIHSSNNILPTNYSQIAKNNHRASRCTFHHCLALFDTYKCRHPQWIGFPTTWSSRWSGLCCIKRGSAVAYQKQEKGSCPKTTWKGVGPGPGVFFRWKSKKVKARAFWGLSEGCLFMPRAKSKSSRFA